MQGRRSEIKQTLVDMKKKYKNMHPDIPESLCYLSNRFKDEYLHDMKICQTYATLNRKTIAKIILNKYYNKNLEDYKCFETVHNYIDEDNIVRKGAVSAKKDEMLLIPLNMRDGSLLCKGKGNADWNNTAPHGAGRLMSRKQARNLLSVNEFEKTMDGIYSTSISAKTLDEAPMVYKNADEITKHIHPTATILSKLKPLYNYKAQ